MPPKIRDTSQPPSMHLLRQLTLRIILTQVHFIYATKVRTALYSKNGDIV